MNLALTIPVYACEKQYGNDGEKLLDCLRDVEFELSSNPEYQQLMEPKQVIRPAAAAARWNSRGNRMSGRPCVNERDFGVCKLTGC